LEVRYLFPVLCTLPLVPLYYYGRADTAERLQQQEVTMRGGEGWQPVNKKKVTRVGKKKPEADE
jgi:hypothetical protein